MWYLHQKTRPYSAFIFFDTVHTELFYISAFRNFQLQISSPAAIFRLKHDLILEADPLLWRQLQWDSKKALCALAGLGRTGHGTVAAGGGRGVRKERQLKRCEIRTPDGGVWRGGASWGDLREMPVGGMGRKRASSSGLREGAPVGGVWQRWASWSGLREGRQLEWCEADELDGVVCRRGASWRILTQMS